VKRQGNLYSRSFQTEKALDKTELLPFLLTVNLKDGLLHIYCREKQLSAYIFSNSAISATPLCQSMLSEPSLAGNQMQA
jgi:hypothetical protein